MLCQLVEERTIRRRYHQPSMTGSPGTPPPSLVAETLWTRVRSMDLKIIAFLRRRSVALLRVSLGIVFLWFGALKVTERRHQ